jgi:hypothetical protein
MQYQKHFPVLDTHVCLGHACASLDLWRLQLLAHSAQQLAQALHVLSTRRLVVRQQALDAAVEGREEGTVNGASQGGGGQVVSVSGHVGG